MKLIDPDEARRQTDEAIARAERGADEDWKQAARWAIYLVCRTTPIFTGDDIWETGLPRPREPRALGPLILWAAGKGMCRKTGRMVPSQIPKDHRNPHYEWESLIA